jgi:nucleoid-associated protein YgaU
MNKYAILTVFASLAILLAGCSPTMSQTKFSKEELSWQKAIRDNYSGYCPPRTSAPALQEREGMIVTRAVAPAPKANVVEPVKTTNEELVVEEFKPTEKQQQTAKTVDEAADKTAKKDAPKADAKKDAKKDAPKADVKADAKKDAKKDAPKADVKADAKKDAKKDAPKADVKKDAKKDAPVAAMEYTVLKGDTLGKIAQKFYGDAQKFELIVKANPKLTDPKKLKVGAKIQIPRY